MSIPFWIENLFHTFVDTAYANIPQAFPGKEQLGSCKIISHRGEHDNKLVFENTLQAFDQITDNGIWGIEFDVRWTKDLHPIVFHDKDLKRLFNSSVQIQKVTLAELKNDFPMIPCLEEIITRYGKSIHLMIEIKEEVYSEPVRQNRMMKELFSSLTPEIDYHFVSLHPEMFRFFDFLPKPACLPIAQLNSKEFSEIAIEQKYGGVMGQYFLLSNSLVKKHLSLGQNIGTGFIGSKNCLFRELNRGVEWLFSNNSIELQSICNSFL
ncbi:MAG: glycerophosphodiester phosphodiesterase [Desulfobacterales bacterium]|nr:glycerophosphodiester phosphodiesterase [Desulfobacterales bacterium]